jgi:hypothetical protein
MGLLLRSCSHSVRTDASADGFTEAGEGSKRVESRPSISSKRDLSSAFTDRVPPVARISQSPFKSHNTQRKTEQTGNSKNRFLNDQGRSIAKPDSTHAFS